MEQFPAVRRLLFTCEAASESAVRIAAKARDGHVSRRSEKRLVADAASSGGEIDERDKGLQWCRGNGRGGEVTARRPSGKGRQQVKADPDARRCPIYWTSGGDAFQNPTFHRKRSGSLCNRGVNRSRGIVE